MSLGTGRRQQPVQTRLAPLPRHLENALQLRGTIHQLDEAGVLSFPHERAVDDDVGHVSPPQLGERDVVRKIRRPLHQVAV